MKDLKEIAKAYAKLLYLVDWDDEILKQGLKEGLNKFLSNAYIYIMKKNLGLKSNHKYQMADFVSLKAEKQIKKGTYEGLVFEHMIPKEKYIQEPCIKKSIEIKINNEPISELEDFILNKLKKYWKLAVVTKEEDKLLSRNKMPDNWDKKNIKARYEAAKIPLTKYNKKNNI